MVGRSFKKLRVTSSDQFAVYSLQVKKVKNTVPRTYVINDLNGDKIIREFYENELQKTNQQEFRIDKIVKGKFIMIH